MSLLLRVALFAVVGLFGWIVGSIPGIVVGIVLDLIFLSDQPAGPSTTEVSFVWSTAALGAVAGLVAAWIWLARQLRLKP